jgi:hypothetical protein
MREAEATNALEVSFEEVGTRIFRSESQHHLGLDIDVDNPRRVLFFITSDSR